MSCSRQQCSDELTGGTFTFSIITEAHPSLSKANGVFSLRDAIELFQLGLFNTLYVISAIPEDCSSHPFSK